MQFHLRKVGQRRAAAQQFSPVEFIRPARIAPRRPRVLHDHEGIERSGSTDHPRRRAFLQCRHHRRHGGIRDTGYGIEVRPHHRVGGLDPIGQARHPELQAPAAQYLIRGPVDEFNAAPSDVDGEQRVGQRPRCPHGIGHTEVDPVGFGAAVDHIDVPPDLLCGLHEKTPIGRIAQGTATEGAHAVHIEIPGRLAERRKNIESPPHPLG